MRTKEEIESRFLKNINLLLNKPDPDEDADIRSDASKELRILHWAMGGEI